MFDKYIEHRTYPGGRTGRAMAKGNGHHESASVWGLHARHIGRKLVTAVERGRTARWHAAIARSAPTIRGKVQASARTTSSKPAAARYGRQPRPDHRHKAALTWAREHRLPADMARLVASGTRHS